LNAEHQELWSHLAHTTDARALVLEAAMIVEHQTSKLIESLMPGYDSLPQPDFFGRLQLLRALNLIPSVELDGADTIRKIRNNFAHDLAVSSLEQEGTGFSDKLRQALIKLVTGEAYDNKSSTELYLMLAQLLDGLFSVRQQTFEAFRAFIESSYFQSALSKFVAHQRATASVIAEFQADQGATTADHPVSNQK